jgi:hypothetical protein
MEEKKYTMIAVQGVQMSIRRYAGVLAALLFFFCAHTASAASLSFSPASGVHAAGETFSVTVTVASSGQAMNAASGVVTFPPDKLQVVSLSKSGSIFNLWAQEPSFSNGAGTVSFEGVVLNPGFSGSSGKILSITFKAKTAGSAALGFSSSSILANDGSGTPILTGTGTASFQTKAAETPPETVPIVKTANTAPAAPEIASSTHPDESKWYAGRSGQFSWTVPAGTLSVRES